MAYRWDSQWGKGGYDQWGKGSYDRWGKGSYSQWAGMPPYMGGTNFCSDIFFHSSVRAGHWGMGYDMDPMAMATPKGRRGDSAKVRSCCIFVESLTGYSQLSRGKASLTRIGSTCRDCLQTSQACVEYASAEDATTRGCCFRSSPLNTKTLEP